MKIATFEVNGRVSYGIVKDQGVVDAGSRLGARFPDLRSVISAGQINRAWKICGASRRWISRLREIRLLKPIPNPGKILCVGVNYPDRAAEYKDNSEKPKYPSIFVRFPASLVAHEEPIVRPPESKQLDYEGEVALVMGRRAGGSPRATQFHTLRDIRFATRARFATGCAMGNSTLHRGKISRGRVHWVLGW